LLNKDIKLYGGAREGNNDDKAHPPIYPVKLASQSDFEKKEEL
jgi:DNA topoisomerase IA